MPNRLNLEGSRFGRLLVVSYAGGGFWNVVCDCGQEKKMRTAGVQAARSCGCVRAEKSRERGEERQNYKICPVCGIKFACSPSSKTVTCSLECRKKRRSELLTGKRRPAETRGKIGQSHKQLGCPETFGAMLEKNAGSPKCRRGSMHSAAKIWLLESLATHDKINIVNLRNWIRENINCFDRKSDDIDADADRIVHVFYKLKSNYIRGLPWVSAYGWKLVGFDDRTNSERHYKF